MSPLEAARDRLLGLQAEAFAVSDDASSIRALRAETRELFAAQGLPSTRHEEWRYTSLSELAGVELALPDRAAPGPGPDRQDVEALAFPVFACGLFVFVNGRFRPELSAAQEAGVAARVESLAAVRRSDPARLEPQLGRLADPKLHPFVALAGAFLDDGAVVTVPRGADASVPIHLVFLTTGDAPCLASPRVLLRAEPGSRATVIQDFVSLSPAVGHLRNAVTEVALGEDAEVRLVTLERGHPDAFLFTHLAARQERSSRLHAHTVTLGGRLVRNDVSVVLAGEGAECSLDGLFLAGGRELVDNHTLVDHAVPHCTSRELYKGILDGHGRGVFRGRVIVRPDAQKTNAFQSNPNLLLADGAEIDTKPQLEIYADDVKCSHGSSIGRIDENALFYLRSRGLSEQDARRLMVVGFAGEVLSRLPDPGLASALGDQLREQLGGGEAR